MIALASSARAASLTLDGGAGETTPPSAEPDGGGAAPGDAGTGDAAADARPDGEASFEPPRSLGGTDVPYPADGPAHVDSIAVTVKLLVDVTGAVQKVLLTTPPGPCSTTPS